MISRQLDSTEAIWDHFMLCGKHAWDPQVREAAEALQKTLAQAYAKKGDR